MKELVKFSITLLLICAAASFLLSTVYALTKPKIEAQKQTEELQSLKEVVPQAQGFNPIKKNEEIIYYEAKSAEDKIIGYAFKAFGKGYSSTIETMVGMSPDGKILNIKIISQNETPGLGTRIAEVEQTATFWDKIKSQETPAPGKPWFQEQFSNIYIDEFDKIDAISGATISSQAVIDSVKERAQEILKLITPHSRVGNERIPHT